MLAQTLFALLPLVSLAFAGPVHTPTRPTFSAGKGPLYKETTEGTSPSQGAHSVPSDGELESSFSSLLAIDSAVTGLGLNWYNPNFSAGNAGYSDPNNYVCYRGIKENFPPFQNWMKFADMFNLNQQHSMVRVDSGPEQGAIYDAIVRVSQESKVDARLILAVIMQESGANVHVGCTNNGIQNCGIMQAYTGSVSYDPNNMFPSILQMVRDGTQGTAVGPGYVQWMSQNDWTRYAGDTQGNPYQAARGYNSGQINFSNLSDPRGATDAYVSDLANRLLGWNGNSCGNARWMACGWQTSSWC